MFEILFLGTSASAPSVHRSPAATLVIHDGFRFLVDCGEGTQRQILRSEIGFKQLNRILLTHGHLDHILGLGGLVATLIRWEAIGELEIFGGRYALERVRALIDGVVLQGVQTPMPLHYREISPGTFFEAGNFRVTAFPVSHRGPGCLGYLFEEQARRPFLAEKATDLGVPDGPERGQLVNGHPITLEDGRTISPEDVLGPLQPGAKLAVVGDTGRTDNLIEIARDADALVIESTYIDKEMEMARRYSHLTARDAAELAVRAGVKKLFLTHISRRYRTKDVLAEARTVFPNTIIARDFDRFQIKHDQQ